MIVNDISQTEFFEQIEPEITLLIEEIREDAFRFKVDSKGLKAGSDVPNI